PSRTPGRRRGAARPRAGRVPPAGAAPSAGAAARRPPRARLRAWPRPGRARRRSRHEAVADAPDRLQALRTRGIVLDLLPQPPHVDGDGAGVERAPVAPDALHQLVAREDPPRVAGKEPQHVVI